MINVREQVLLLAAIDALLRRGNISDMSEANARHIARALSKIGKPCKVSPQVSDTVYLDAPKLWTVTVLDTL